MASSIFHFPGGCSVSIDEYGCRWAVSPDGAILCELFQPDEPGEDECEGIVETDLEGFWMSEPDCDAVAIQLGRVPSRQA